jgi:PKD repeat protein
VNGNDIAIENLTLNDTSGYGASPAQALMLETNIKRFILNNVEMLSFQDTTLGNTSDTQAYFDNCLIQGQTDFIWGGMNAFFTNCEIRCRLSGSHITQPRTDPGSNGMSFVNCQLTRSSNAVVSCDLGRALSYSNTSVAYINCRIDDHITGWNASDIGNPSLNLRWWEYGNSNLAATAAVTYNGVQLTNGDARVTLASIATNWLNGWAPQLAPNILSQPTNLTVNASQTAAFTVSATGIPEPSYQWLKNGTNILGATGATLTILNAQAGDAATYSVIVSNMTGTVTSSNATLTVIDVAPSVNFTASPTSGTEPLTVTFTDTSVGTTPISLSWDLGDSTTTNTAGGTSFVHEYGPGTYTVTLTASNSIGSSTLVSNNLITVSLTAFHAWQLQYFSCTNCPQAAESADPDGDGQNNSAEFQAGTNPTNSLSGLRIISTVQRTTDVVVTWTTAGGRTNAVQASGGDASGGYTNAFADISGWIIIAGSGDVTTNYVDSGGATNVPARYYRVRLVP